MNKWIKSNKNTTEKELKRGYHKTQCSLFAPPCFNISTALLALVNKVPSFCVTFPSSSRTASSKPHPADLMMFRMFSSFRTTEPSWASSAHHFVASEWREGVVVVVVVVEAVSDSEKWHVIFRRFFFFLTSFRKNSPELVFWERIIVAWVYLIRWRVGTRWLRVCIVIEVSWSRDACCIPGIPWIWIWVGAAEGALVEGGGEGMIELRMGIWWRWR